MLEDMSQFHRKMHNLPAKSKERNKEAKDKKKKFKKDRKPQYAKIM